MGEYICPYCDARLDPGEKCDCKNEEKDMYEISDKEIDRFYGEYERPTRWNGNKYPYRGEEPDDVEEEDDDE